jgi:hypothetical protein
MGCRRGGAAARPPNPRLCFSAATFRFDPIQYIGTESNYLEDVDVASPHAEPALVPNRLLPWVALTAAYTLCPCR